MFQPWKQSQFISGRLRTLFFTLFIGMGTGWRRQLDYSQAEKEWKRCWEAEAAPTTKTDSHTDRSEAGKGDHKAAR